MTQEKIQSEGTAAFTEQVHPFFQPKKLENRRVPYRELPLIWEKCPGCQELHYLERLHKNKRVCLNCGFHLPMPALERVNLIMDQDSWKEVNGGLTTVDPLGFAKLDKNYARKINDRHSSEGNKEALMTCFGTCEGFPLAMAVTDFTFMAATLSCGFGEKLVRLVELCLARRMPLLTVSASGGARIQEGAFALMQMAKTSAALGRLGEAGLLHISLLTDPCYGGTTASYASLADIILAEPGARIGFAGPRVINQVTHQNLPAGFQTAEFFMQHGFIDRITPRSELRPTLCRLIKLYARAEISRQFQQDSQIKIRPRPVNQSRKLTDKNNLQTVRKVSKRNSNLILATRNILKKGA